MTTKKKSDFVAVNITVLTVSDTRNEKTDSSGRLLVEQIVKAGHRLVEKRIVPDDPEIIHATLLNWCQHPDVDVVISTGGTGITGRDTTPDVMATLFTKAIPGFGELFRMLSYEEIGSSTIQSRAVGGLAGTTLLFALPGSGGACRLGWEQILVHQLDIRHKPCNLVELMPRFAEV
jgi:molybdenum cofactor biosynthesis protein B